MRRPALLLLAVLMMAVALPVLAAEPPITQSKTFTGTPDYLKEFSFDQFNKPGYKLDSIEVVFTLWIDGGYLSVDNDGALPATVIVKLGADGAISSTDVPLLNSSFLPVVPQANVFTSSTFNLGADNGDGAGNVDPSGPDGATHNGALMASSKSGFIAPSLFTPYIGAGTYKIAVDCSQILDFGGIGGVEGAFGPVNSGGSLAVIYRYSPVPEPSSMVAMLAGLGGLAGLISRKRRSK